MLHSIPAYVVRFMIAMLPFLGTPSSSQDTNDSEPATQQEQMDLKKGNGLEPASTFSSCNYCPPMC